METFLSGRYQVDINTDNPLGQGGKLAHSFGSLMEKLWQVGAGHGRRKGVQEVSERQERCEEAGMGLAGGSGGCRESGTGRAQLHGATEAQEHCVESQPACLPIRGCAALHTAAHAWQRTMT